MLGFGKRKSVSPGNIAAVVSGQIIPIEKVKDEAFAKKMMGKSNQTYFSADKLWAGTPNEHVYNMLEDAWFRDMLG